MHAPYATSRGDDPRMRQRTLQRLIEHADNAIPHLKSEDPHDRAIELAARLWIEDYVDRLRASLGAAFRDERLETKALVFCTCDPNDLRKPPEAFDAPRALAIIPSDGKLDDEFVEAVNRTARAGFALATAYVFGVVTPAGGDGIMVTLHFLGDAEAEAWVAPCIDAPRRRLGPFEAKGRVHATRPTDMH